MLRRRKRLRNNNNIKANNEVIDENEIMDNIKNNVSIDGKKSIIYVENECKQEINDNCIETNNQIIGESFGQKVMCDPNEDNIVLKLKTDESFGNVLVLYKSYETNDDNESEEAMVYRRDSFDDRICDDLCSVVLTYLSFREKIRLESVSKQFQSNIYVKQNGLSLKLEEDNDSNGLNQMIDKHPVPRNGIPGYKWLTINTRILANILIKCNAINTIVIVFHNIQWRCEEYFQSKFKSMEAEVLDVIIKHANNLKQFTCDFTEISDYLFDCFVDKFGHKLEKLSLNNNYTSDNNIKDKTKAKFLNMCPNLITAKGLSVIDFFDENNALLHLKKLKNIGINFHNDISGLTLKFIDCYGLQIRHLLLGALFGENEVVLGHLVKFKNLEILEFDSFAYHYDKTIDKIKSIGVQCKQIHTIISHGGIILDKNFLALASFKNLKVIRINDRACFEHDKLRCAVLEKCINLKKFDLYGISFNENFFNDVHLYVPNLTDICITNENTKNCKLILESLSKLVNLKKLVMIMSFEESIDEEINQLISNSKSLETIKIDYLVKISNHSINKLISIAKENPNIEFDLKFSTISDDTIEKYSLKFY